MGRVGGPLAGGSVWIGQARGALQVRGPGTPENSQGQRIQDGVFLPGVLRWLHPQVLEGRIPVEPGTHPVSGGSALLLRLSGASFEVP